MIVIVKNTCEGFSMTCKNMVKKQDIISNLRYDLKIGQEGEGTLIYSVNNSYL